VADPRAVGGAAQAQLEILGGEYQQRLGGAVDSVQDVVVAARLRHFTSLSVQGRIPPLCCLESQPSTYRSL
jgi:hypothetical protein